MRCWLALASENSCNHNVNRCVGLATLDFHGAVPHKFTRVMPRTTYVSAVLVRCVDSLPPLEEANRLGVDRFTFPRSLCLLDRPRRLAAYVLLALVDRPRSPLAFVSLLGLFTGFGVDRYLNLGSDRVGQCQGLSGHILCAGFSGGGYRLVMNLLSCERLRDYRSC